MKQKLIRNHLLLLFVLLLLGGISYVGISLRQDSFALGTWAEQLYLLGVAVIGIHVLAIVLVIGATYLLKKRLWRF